MAYAGICGPDDLQPHTDPYFSAATVEEVNDYTTPGLPDVVEVQTVSLREFGPGDTLTLGFDGETRDIPFAVYNSVTLNAELDALTGQDVTVAQWEYDPFGHHVLFPAPVLPVDHTGFQVIFAPSPNPEAPELPDGVDPVNQPRLTVGGTGVTGFAGETAQGGPAENDGHERIATGNRAPTVKVPANRTIPIRTPFTLRGSAKDADGHKPTLLWEQIDWGNSAIDLTSNAKKFGPLFRVFGESALVTDEGTLQSPSPGLNIADRNGSRTFPDMKQVLRGNTNARSGRCPRFDLPDDPDAEVPPVPQRLVDCYSEFLPIKSYRGTPGQGRKMHFRLSARDGFDEGGGLGYDEMSVRIDPSAGPFLVKSFKKGGKVRPGSFRTIKWDVNGTKKLAKKVRILLSTNGGRTWRKTLVKATANDGRAIVKFPRVKTRKARIMIAANGNYFFDVNDKRFRIRR